MKKNWINRKYLLNLGIASIFSLGVSSAFAAKDVVMGVNATLLTLDPYNANDTLTHAISKTFYQTLYYFDKDLKLQPALAESYSVSDDGLTYTFNLIKNVKFHDGTDFNADSVKVNFERVLDPANNLRRHNMFSNISKVDVIDPQTVKITLKEPSASFINTVAHPSAAMISPTALQKYGKDIGTNPVGTGPFKFVSWSTDIKGAKFDGFWREGYPKVDSITWKPIVDNNARSAALQTGEIHYSFPIANEQIELLKKDKNIDVVTSPSIVSRAISFNTLHKPFDNREIRRAMNYAFDRKAIAKVAYNGYADMVNSSVPLIFDYATKQDAWEYNPQKAKEILAKEGYPNGFNAKLWSVYNNPQAAKLLQVVQQQLAKIGVKTEIQMFEIGQAYEKILGVKKPEDAQADMVFFGWGASTGEIDWALTPLFATKSWVPNMMNMSYYSNKTVDDNLTKAIRIQDKAEKEKLYAEAQDIIWNDSPWAYLVSEQLLAGKNKRLSGIDIIPDGSLIYETIELN